jgi:hypothetical protein
MNSGSKRFSSAVSFLNTTWFTLNVAHETLENREDFQDLLNHVVTTLSESDVGLTTTQVVESVYGKSGVYPIILVTGMLGCLSALGAVDFAKAGRARVWKIKDEKLAQGLLSGNRKDDIIYS